MEQVKAEPVALKRWHEMQDDTLEIVACGKRWTKVAEKIGCKYVSVYAWGMRGGKVPKKHHSAIIAASEGKLTQADFE